MEVENLIDMILESYNIVFFGGAGVSTESGIPDFRSATGLYNRNNNTGHSPEYMLSHDFLVADEQGFSKYYKENLISKNAQPNVTHKVLAKLEQMKKLRAIVTQNIDSLHQKAGSKNVYEIHGNLRDFYCVKCGRKYPEEEILSTSGANYCSCGGFIRPDVTLYGEGLPESSVIMALDAISKADVLIIGGTSLAVYPAASFVNYYNGNKCILINKDETSRDNVADYVLHTSLGDFFSELEKRLKKY